MSEIDLAEEMIVAQEERYTRQSEELLLPGRID